MYTNDAGKTWGHSQGGMLSQSAHKFPSDSTGMKFGVTGTIIATNAQAIGVTSNGGRTFTRYTNLGLFTEVHFFEKKIKIKY